MADQEHNLNIISWPEKNKAKLEHSFESEKPCPVSIRFDEDSSDVRLNTSPKEPMNVAMNMNVSADDPFPVAFRLGESICASSDYVVGLQIFDHQVATVHLKGLTKLFGCGQNEERCPGREPPTKAVCVAWRDELETRVVPSGEVKEGFTFESEDEMRVVLWQNVGHLVIPDGGMTIRLPFPSSLVECQIAHYKLERVEITAYGENGEDVGSYVHQGDGETPVIQAAIDGEDISFLRLTSVGDSQAMLRRLCATPNA